MVHRYVIAIALSVTLAGAVTSARASPDVPPSQFVESDRHKQLIQALPQIETMLLDRIKDLRIPGLAYGIVIDDEVVVAKGLGVRDIATGAPVDADTVFRIASMTKSFTALAILKLRDAGKLNLDDPVARYVPELALWQLPTKDSGPVTVRHLLNHSAGFPEDNPYADRLLAMKPAALSDWLNAGVPFASATGSAFEYSNLGFMILGEVVSRVSGRPFQTYVTEEILLPLGMRSTFWSPTAVPKDHQASGYRQDGESLTPEPVFEDGAGAAAGGLMTTSRDLARYISMMLGAFPPRDDPERPPALRRTLREMQLGTGLSGVFTDRPLPGGPMIARGYSYGFGLFSIDDCGWGKEVSHSGGLPGFGSHMRWLPNHGVGIFVLANLTYAQAAGMTRAAISMLQNTGAMKPRQAVPSPALLGMVQATRDLVVDWGDDRARAIAADNLFVDESLEMRKVSINALRTGLGACKLGQINAENALRGRFRVDCEKGWLNVTLSLAPTQPARVQFLEVGGGRPPSAALRQFAEATTQSMGNGARDLRLAPKLNRRALSATLESARLAYGACRLGDAIEGDGVTKAKFALTCDRGALELALSLEDDRLASATLSPPSDALCVP
jgi:CubicO group peptidase (beta-lactamase class C family)